VSPFARGFVPSKLAPAPVSSPSAAAVNPNANPLTDTKTKLYGWLTDVHYLATRLSHNDNATCILAIGREIIDCEIDGLDAMIAKGKELCPEFYSLLRTLVKECTALSGLALVDMTADVFGLEVQKPAPKPAPVARPVARPLPFNPLLAPPAPTPQQTLL